MSPIRRIVIVGGGTSGWLSAAYLSKRLGSAGEAGPDITLIESRDIPTVGVGEATIPPMRSMVQALGVDEADFMRETSATFKNAIKFDDWLHAPGDRRHSYYHTFGPFGLVGQELLAGYWAADAARRGQSFVDFSMIEGRICDAGRGPKRVEDQPFAGPVQYAYHFDAGLVAAFLKKLSAERGVTHLVGTVEKTELDEDGAIATLRTKEHGRLTADLYVDCTGFAAHLIEKALGTEFESLNNILFCDRAVACQAPYKDPKQPIAPYTIATAQEAGWTWDIPLSNRRGVGYVYSSRYTEEARAEELLRGYLGADGEGLGVWHLKMRVGKRRRQWHKNCIAIGLSGGFIEPLESTGIYLVDIALRWLADLLLPPGEFPRAAAQFNARMNACYADIVDFVKMHYALSRRDDSAFWVDNQKPEHWPASLADKLEGWRRRVPSSFEFGNLPGVFGLTNYLQVLYGMDYLPDLDWTKGRYADRDAATRESARLAKMAQGGITVLPDHRSLIEALYVEGFTAAPGAQRIGTA